MLKIPFQTAAWILSSILWSLLLLYLSLTPAPPHVEGPFGWDKLQHAAALGCSAILVGRICLELRRSLFFSLITGFVSASLFGALIELLQWLYTANRQAEAADLAADMIGALFAMVLLYFFKKIKGTAVI